jgi:ABC-2 type transport system ATP-binding protein
MTHSEIERPAAQDGLLSEAAVQDSAIRANGLRRTFRRKHEWLRKSGEQIVGLDDISLTVPVGEVHGLLGPNGAGKSTFCKILATVLVPTAGTAQVLGYDVERDKQAVRRSLALVLGGERGLYYRLTARQNLRFWGSLYGISGADAAVRGDALLDRVGLAHRCDDRVETYSRGMQQRLQLARGLLTDPSVLLLDEPTTGLDPVATRDFHALVNEVRRERTILLTTHDMTEAERLCDRVSLINNGRIIATEAPSALGRRISRFERIDVGDADEALLEKVRMIAGVGRVAREPEGSIRIETVAKGAAAEVLRLLVDNGHTDVRASVPSLEEVYIRLFGHREQVGNPDQSVVP